MFKEVASLDAEVTVALGKKNKQTGKPYPKSAEGYYLGNRKVESKRGESNLHFLQTEDGNLGVWGTTDLDRKLAQVDAGSMIRITSTGTKPTPNGEMYTYRVEVDATNTINVSGLASESYSSNDDEGSEDNSDLEDSGDGDYEEQPVALAAPSGSNKRSVQEILNRKSK